MAARESDSENEEDFEEYYDEDDPEKPRARPVRARDSSPARIGIEHKEEVVRQRQYKKRQHRRNRTSYHHQQDRAFNGVYMDGNK